MIDALNAQPNAGAGFSAKTLYKTGQEYGLTCKEVLETFLGKHKAISRGLYAATLESDVKVVKAAAKKAVKATVKATVKANAKATAKAVEDVDNCNDSEDNTAVFCYIATPEEIAES